MTPQFWKGKRVLLTGHTGFKGGWLSVILKKMGARLIGYSLDPPTRPSLFEILQVDQGMVSRKGDIRDLNPLVRVMKKYRPEIVIHMAAQAILRHSYRFPVETFDTNLMGTVNVLEAVRQTRGTRAVLIITTDKCYENREWARGYREEDTMGGHDPYSSSKGCAELAVASYRRSFFSVRKGSAAVASARAGNVFGGGDWAKDRLVPDVMRSFMAGRPVVLRHPGAVRPWQHVLEPVFGYMELVEKLWQKGDEFAEGWNFGPKKEGCKPVSWVVDRLAQEWRGKAAWKKDARMHPHEARLLKLDTTKANTRLGWHPKLDLATALKWTADWYKAYQEKRDMRGFTDMQIEDYMAREGK